MSVLTVAEKISAISIKFYLTQPFFGSIITRLRPRKSDEWLETAAVDGRNFYYNEEFFKKLSFEEAEFVIAHEVMHCVYDHMGRGEYLDKEIYNWAADYCINLELKDFKIGKVPTSIGVLIDEKYRGMYSEEVYSILKKQRDKDLKQLLKQIGEGNFDVHLEDPDSDGCDNDTDKNEDGPGGCKGPERYTKADLGKISEEIKNAIIQGASLTKDAGKEVPGGIRKFITELTEPEIDWKSQLNAQIQSLMKGDYTWSRPSRKSWSCGFYLPGQEPEPKIDLHICIDTSGSISESMLRDFLSEVKGIMEQYAAFTIQLWCFDTRVYTICNYDENCIEDLNDFKMEGGGGTQFECNWDYLEENQIIPEKFIMFTDGYPCGSWGDPNYCDSIFVVHGDKNLLAPFGITIHYPK